MERIATIVAGDRDRGAVLAHFRGPARRGASAGSVHRTGPEDKDLRLAARPPRYPPRRRDRRFGTFALRAGPQGCNNGHKRTGNLRERGRRRIAALVDMQIDIETALRGEAKYGIEKRIDIVDRPRINATDSARHTAENAT
jgi:hypothetical protein